MKSKSIGNLPLIAAAVVIASVSVCSFVVCCSHTKPPTQVALAVCDHRAINPEGVRLNVPIFVQHCQWCWATDVAMIGTYYKKDPIRPCDLVTQTATTALAVTSSAAKITATLDCCTPYACATACNHGGDNKQIERAFQLTGYPHTVIQGKILELEIMQQLSSGRPIMLTVVEKVKEVKNAHVRIVSGFRPQTRGLPNLYTVLDSNKREALEERR